LDEDRAQDTKGAPLKYRWHYFAAHNKPTKRRLPHEVWRLLDNDYQYQVVRRGAFFDAEKGRVILDRFAELEPAQRCIEEKADRSPKKRNRRPKERDPRAA
jgi:hypothetical protein